MEHTPWAWPMFSVLTLLMHMLHSDGIAKGPCQLFFRLLCATLSLLHQLLHGGGDGEGEGEGAREVRG